MSIQNNPIARTAGYYVSQLIDIMKNKKLISRLEKLRGEKSKRAFARFCELSDSTMRGYLSGNRHPSTDNLEKIARPHGTTIDWLVSGRMPDIRLLSEEILKLLFQQDPEVIDIETDNNRIFPVVRAYDDESTQLHVYCIHCRKWHHHGRGGKEAEYQEGRGGSGGHRTTHCITENSPFHTNGIILDVVGKYSDVKKDKDNSKELLCPNCIKYYSAAFNACSCGYINNRRKSRYKALVELYQNSAFDFRTEEKETREGLQKGTDNIPPPQKSEAEKRITIPPTTRIEGHMAIPQSKESKKLSKRENFKRLAAKNFDVIFDFIADEYGEDSSGIEDFKDNFTEKFENYKRWREKKRISEDLQTNAQGNLIANDK